MVFNKVNPKIIYLNGVWKIDENYTITHIKTNYECYIGECKDGTPYYNNVNKHLPQYIKTFIDKVWSNKCL